LVVRPGQISVDSFRACSCTDGIGDSLELTDQGDHLIGVANLAVECSLMNDHEYTLSAFPVHVISPEGCQATVLISTRKCAAAEYRIKQRTADQTRGRCYDEQRAGDSSGDSI
jgi:hypothetical protein